MVRLFRKKVKRIGDIQGNVINVAGDAKSNGRALQVHLTESNPVSDWIRYDSGDGFACFSTLATAPDGTACVLGGSVEIESIIGSDATREYAACKVIKNTADLSTPFEFTADFLGTTGQVMTLPKNCCFRLVLTPNAGDDVYFEIGMSNS